MRQKIVLYPEGGLGNRIRVINSTIALAKANRLALTVIWLKDKGCNCQFDDVLQVDVANVQVKNGRALDRLRYYFLKFLGKSKLFTTFVLYDCANLTPASIRRKSVWMITCHRVVEKYGSYVNFSRLIRTKGEKFLPTLKDNLVGIHIRTTDNKESQSVSPYGLFEQKIEQLLSNDASTSFFVCSDSQEVKERLITKFNHNIVTFNSQLKRNTYSGMVDAATELYLLSKTRYILGSYYSSFSEIASEIGNIKLHIVHN